MKNILSKFLLLPIAFFSASPLMADEGGARSGSMMQTLIMIGIAIVFFYFILWRPENKRRKALEQKRSGMKKGDKVTAMGIIGVIDSVKETTVVLKMIDGSKVEFVKAAVSEVAQEEVKEAKKEAKEATS
ncbi:MAG: hypothetical protein S4CHLAM45_06280 [Chlamydiales bacterium]|nr:hypothetical protein [Chlamydiales bacterium]MCH9619832.1 hypothetical protein [Chlamydiales bacterium]MCH9622741.1 hypothetical protein [Chlamydiales bacterium]